MTYFTLYSMELGLAGFLFAWLILNFEPLVAILAHTSESLYAKRFKMPKWCFWSLDTLLDVVQCPKCLTFWLTLAMTGNLPVAIMFAIFATILDKIKV